jgi:hypothetical protein
MSIFRLVRKTRRILIPVFVFLALIVSSWLLFSPRDSSQDRPFRGQAESVWIQGLKYRDEDQVKEWRTYGDEGVRVLIRALDRANHPYERVYRKAWRRTLHFVWRILPAPRPDSTRVTRMCVTDLLSRLSKDAKIAEPAMAREITDENSSVRAIALTYFTAGEDQNTLLNQMDAKEKRRLLPLFIAAMKDDDWSVRNNALVALNYYPEESQLVVPVFVKVLQDPAFPQLHGLAAKYLKQMDPAAAAKADVK